MGRTVPSEIGISYERPVRLSITVSACLSVSFSITCSSPPGLIPSSRSTLYYANFRERQSIAAPTTDAAGRLAADSPQRLKSTSLRLTLNAVALKPAVTARPHHLRPRRHDADRAVGFQDRHLHVFQIADAVLADRHHHQLFVQPLAPQVLFDELAVVDQKRGRAFQGPPQKRQPLARLGQAVVNGYQNGGGDKAAGDRGIGAHHRVLHGVGDEQDDHKIEGRHLALFSLAGEAEADEHGGVDDDGAGYDAPAADFQPK